MVPALGRDDIYYEALKSRDYRFDGKFFTGVKTTGVYCRPICPARPKRQNVEFFPNPWAAERAGYRPCLRCRPESAPLSPTWIGKSAVVRRAVKVLHSQDPIDFDEDRFAALFGVTARHLRRLFADEIGKTPKQLAFENRLNLARKLLVETRLPIGEVGFAAGFRSVRRFNDAFRDRFRRSPQEVRRQPLSTRDGLVVSLPYRPPFDYRTLLSTYRSHRVGSLEEFTDDRMRRLVGFDGKVGWIEIANDPDRSRLLVEIDFPDTTVIHWIIARVRTLFDLDSDPALIANSLEADAATAALLRKNPGIRLPAGWDPYETAVSAILGQLVSVPHARALVADLIEMLGRDSGVRAEDGRAIRLFPSPAEVAAAELGALKTTAVRRQTLQEFSRLIAVGKLSLAPTQEVERFMSQVTEIRGIGPWTANYLALRVLRHTDAFPATDLILARALELHPREAVSRMSPWRGYAAALYWREYAEKLKKSRNRSSQRGIKR